jgi:hypothetical protein
MSRHRSRRAEALSPLLTRRTRRRRSDSRDLEDRSDLRTISERHAPTTRRARAGIESEKWFCQEFRGFAQGGREVAKHIGVRTKPLARRTLRVRRARSVGEMRIGVRRFASAS